MFASLVGLLFCRWPARLNAVLRRCRRLGYLDDTDAVCVDELFQSSDDKLFAETVHNSAHVLQPLIPDRPPSSCDLRPRTHDKLLLDKTSYLNDREFVIRVLCRDSYWLLYMSVKYVLIFLFLYSLLSTLDFCQKLRLSAFSLKNKWMNEWMSLVHCAFNYCVVWSLSYSSVLLTPQSYKHDGFLKIGRPE